MPANYDNKGMAMFTMLFVVGGSAIPKASFAAAISAGFSIFLNLFRFGYIVDWPAETLLTSIDLFTHPLGSQIFSMLLGYVIVFRTNMALSRYWAGCTDLQEMFGKWLDSFSLIMSFIRTSKTRRPKNIEVYMAHWFTLMAALAVVRLRSVDDCAIPPVRQLAHFQPRKQNLPVLSFAGKDIRKDPEWFLGTLCKITPAELESLETTDNKMRMVAFWIVNSLEIYREKNWVVCAPPILTRAYQELSNGLLGLDEALKLCNVPFPFPFMQLITVLLIVNTFQLPFVICQFSRGAIWSVCLTFFVVIGYWGLYFICVELENPYGEDANDLPLVEMQRDFCRAVAQMRALHIPKPYLDDLGITPEPVVTPTTVTDTEMPSQKRRKTITYHKSPTDDSEAPTPLGGYDDGYDPDYELAASFRFYKWK